MTVSNSCHSRWSVKSALRSVIPNGTFPNFPFLLGVSLNRHGIHERRAFNSGGMLPNSGGRGLGGRGTDASPALFGLMRPPFAPADGCATIRKPENKAQGPGLSPPLSQQLLVAALHHQSEGQGSSLRPRFNSTEIYLGRHIAKTVRLGF